MSPWLDLNDTDAHEKKPGLQDLLLLKALGPYIRDEWKGVLISIVLLPLISVSQVVQPFIVKYTLDNPVAHGDLKGLATMAGLFALILGVHYSLRYWQMYVAQVTGQRIIFAIRTRLYDHLQGLSIDFFHKNPLGKLVTRISSDVENISEVFSSGGLAIFSDFAVIVGIIIAMFIMNRELAFVTLLILPVVVLTMEFFRRRSREAYNQQRVQLAQINIQLQETLSGVDVVQLLRKEEETTRQFEAVCRDYTKTCYRSILYDSSFTASVEFLALITLLMVVGYVVWQVFDAGHLMISIGMLVAFLQYIQMLFEPIEEISDKFTIIQSGLASVEKILELMGIPAAIQSPSAPQPLVRATGHIKLENVTFGYNPDKQVLKGINLEIKPGEKVAFIGATGAGKSTLIKLINRQYDPQGGRIRVDGEDIRRYAVEDLRRNIVVIPQEEFLFSRTIAANITLDYKTVPDMAKLQSVCEAVHANMICDRLPQGLLTPLPERGRNLSNGERQLLVFARALWHDPAIIILDEATSSIDPQTEGLLQDALDRTLAGRTGIIIAHRLSTIEQVDRIFVLEEGEIVESGSPKELYAQRGRYWNYLRQLNQTPDR